MHQLQKRFLKDDPLQVFGEILKNPINHMDTVFTSDAHLAVSWTVDHIDDNDDTINYDSRKLIHIKTIKLKRKLSGLEQITAEK